MLVSGCTYVWEDVWPPSLASSPAPPVTPTGTKCGTRIEKKKKTSKPHWSETENTNGGCRCNLDMLFFCARAEYSGVGDTITRTPAVSWRPGHLGPSSLITYVMTFIARRGSPQPR